LPDAFGGDYSAGKATIAGPAFGGDFEWPN
jgi:hypothetical protein